MGRWFAAVPGEGLRQDHPTSATTTSERSLAAGLRRRGRRLRQDQQRRPRAARSTATTTTRKTFDIKNSQALPGFATMRYVERPAVRHPVRQRRSAITDACSPSRRSGRPCGSGRWETDHDGWRGRRSSAASSTFAATRSTARFRAAASASAPGTARTAGPRCGRPLRRRRPRLALQLSAASHSSSTSTPATRTGRAADAPGTTPRSASSCRGARRRRPAAGFDRYRDHRLVGHRPRRMAWAAADRRRPVVRPGGRSAVARHAWIDPGAIGAPRRHPRRLRRSATATSTSSSSRTHARTGCSAA